MKLIQHKVIDDYLNGLGFVKEIDYVLMDIAPNGFRAIFSEKGHSLTKEQRDYLHEEGFSILIDTLKN